MKSEKTQAMLQAEKKLGRSFEDGLAELITLRGLSGAAEYLEVSPSQLRYWMGRTGIETAYIALSPEDQLFISRGGEGLEKVLVAK